MAAQLQSPLVSHLVEKPFEPQCVARMGELLPRFLNRRFCAGGEEPVAITFGLISTSL